MPPRLLVVDVVAKVISMVPAPYLQPVVESFRLIVAQVDQVQANRRQMHAIAEAVAQILFALNSRSSEKWVEDNWMTKNRSEFEDLLSRIANFCAKNARKKFFRSFLEAMEIQAEINTIHTQLSLSVDSLQISSQISLQNYHRITETARQEDQAEISLALKQLQTRQDTLLALVGKPSVESSLDQPARHDLKDSPHGTIFGLLTDIKDSVDSPVDANSDSKVLQDVLLELRKISSPQLPPVDPNPIVANLKPGLTADVLIAPLRWQMNVYMRKEQLAQHLFSRQIAKFTKGEEGSKQFVGYLMMTDDLPLQYSALEVFRKDKNVKHFFRPG